MKTSLLSQRIEFEQARLSALGLSVEAKGEFDGVQKNGSMIIESSPIELSKLSPILSLYDPSLPIPAVNGSVGAVVELLIKKALPEASVLLTLDNISTKYQNVSVNSVSGKAKIEASKSKLNLMANNLKGTLLDSRSPFEASADFDLKDLSGLLKFSLDDLELKQVTAIANSYVPQLAQYNLQGRVSPKIELELLKRKINSLKLNSNLAKVAFSVDGQSFSFTEGNLDVRKEQTRLLVILKNAQVALQGASLVNVAAEYRDGKVDAQLQSKGLSLQELEPMLLKVSPALKTYKLRGEVTPDLEIKGSMTGPFKINGSFGVRNAAALVAGKELSNIIGDFALKEQGGGDSNR